MSRKKYYRKKKPVSRWTRYGRRAKYYGGYMTKVGLGYLTQRVAKKVADKYLNVEYKVHAGNSVGDVITKTATNTNYYLTGIAQGDTETTRDGYSIGAKSLFIKGTIDIHASATITNVRMILYEDLRPSSTQFTYDQLLDTTVDTSDTISMRNIDYTKYNRILHDKVYKLDNDTRRRVNFKIFKKMSKHFTWKQGVATGTYADQTVGKLNLMVICDEASNTPSMDVNWRLRYVDN